jgi:urea transport system ATP-binding protein
VALYLDDISVSFDGFKALNALSLAINVGELRCIIGPNGAGKTTMMDCITGKTRPDSGKPSSAATSTCCACASPTSRRSASAASSRSPRSTSSSACSRTWSWRCAPTAACAPACFHRLSGAQLDRIGEVLTLIHLKPEAQRTAGLLSHGQKQWLEIGMLLMQDPKLLLLDEPVAGMTDEETERTAELFLSLEGQHSLVVVEHDMKFVDQLTRAARR